MRSIINASALVKGGGIQVGRSLVVEFARMSQSKDIFLLIASKKFYRSIQDLKLPENFSIIVLENRKFLNKLVLPLKLYRIERNFLPDIVLTVFGPQLWRPRVTHISGFADGWCYMPIEIALNKLNPYKRFKRKILTRLKLLLIFKNSDVVIVETNSAKRGLISKGLETKKIVVIGNTYSDIYNQKTRVNRQEFGPFKILIFSAFYESKNLEIINEVTDILEKCGEHNCVFQLTINAEVFNEKFLGNRYVTNIGPVNPIDGPKLYGQSHLSFLPTLLETFSAVYPESMKSGVPILTSNLEFAKEICGNAAYYCDPNSPRDIAEKIVKLKNDDRLRKRLVRNGLKRLEMFESASSRANKYYELMKNKSEHGRV
jgi:glycosyltransferase involved in cell wall biosynthesis